MKGIKGSNKTFGDRCADCKTVLTQQNAVSRRPPRTGLLSYCRRCMNARADTARRRDPQAHRDRSKAYRKKLRAQVLKGYGGKCACCGESTPEFLALDHVNGGGNKHRREMNIRNPAQICRLVILQGFPPTFRLLCHNCNQASAWFGKCPHARG